MTIVHSKQAGFTLLELLLVMLLLAGLAVLVTSNIRRSQTDASLNATVATLVADIKAQQFKAMAGDTRADGTIEPHGIRFTANNYTLFKDTLYSGASTDNYVVTNPQGITTATTFPVSQVVFSRSSGDVVSFANGTNTITVTSLNDSIVLTVNRYGAITGYP